MAEQVVVHRPIYSGFEVVLELTDHADVFFFAVITVENRYRLEEVVAMDAS